MTDKPEKLLSERILEAERLAQETARAVIAAGEQGRMIAHSYILQRQTLGLLAELAEMMEKK